jgi:hypothetical protein
VSEWVAGVVVGLLSAALIAMLPRGHRGTSLATGLGVAAGIYVGFGLQDGLPKHAITELLLGLPFIAAAIRWPHAVRVLAIAWIAHGLVDAFHLLGVFTTRVPSWYPGACFGVDVALGLAGLYWARSSSAA